MTHHPLKDPPSGRRPPGSVLREWPRIVAIVNMTLRTIRPRSSSQSPTASGPPLKYGSSATSRNALSYPKRCPRSVDAIGAALPCENTCWTASRRLMSCSRCVMAFLESCRPVGSACAQGDTRSGGSPPDPARPACQEPSALPERRAAGATERRNLQELSSVHLSSPGRVRRSHSRRKERPKPQNHWHATANGEFHTTPGPSLSSRGGREEVGDLRRENDPTFERQVRALGGGWCHRRTPWISSPPFRLERLRHYAKRKRQAAIEPIDRGFDHRLLDLQLAEPRSLGREGLEN